jgi:hypothetical protein
VQIDTPVRNVRLRLPKNCDAKQFLEAVFRHPRMPMELRLEAAGLALPYTVPRLIAMVQNNANPNETRLVITGGLPRLPGVNTIMPGDPPAPRAG